MKVNEHRDGVDSASADGPIPEREDPAKAIRDPAITVCKGKATAMAECNIQSMPGWRTIGQ
jgi:hypothetical protein